MRNALEAVFALSVMARRGAEEGREARRKISFRGSRAAASPPAFPPAVPFGPYRHKRVEWSGMHEEKVLFFSLYRAAT